MKRFFISLVIAQSLSLGGLLGCDAAVQQTILSGLETGSTAVSTSLIAALFQNIATQLADDEETQTDTTTTTAQ